MWKHIKHHVFGNLRKRWQKEHFINPDSHDNDRHRHHHAHDHIHRDHSGHDHSFYHCGESGYHKGLIKLGSAQTGTYKFVAAFCDEDLGHRLLEMGFVPGGDVTVIANAGLRGSVMIEIKGSKLALSHKIADNILLMKKDNV
ncbi:FeoA family protein [Endomicrobium proavitum]|uniref:Fe2+-transporter substrate-binding unit (Modular protein) n=1 Tax=Endomicrobium proavitum TaxID=1408281 RepID=A0A0G3WLH4_9BACT|nr:FeoA family protein [Endomicrobium proavitum]AKL98354.1 Fe2+-transporter substrate-binding unit (modular protein) [Endomicrobium proavitum]